MPSYFFALAPLGWVYSGAMALRALMYGAGIFKTRRLACPVVSVGNLTAGGTGKTPMVVYIVRHLMEAGLKPAVLTRGYGGSREGEALVVSTGDEIRLGVSESGDEPALLAGLLPGVPIVMGADRHAAGLLALEKFTPDVVVLDDGFQHMALHRDLDILLMDARRPLGNGRVLPAGYLREPAGAAKRADVVVLTRSEALDADGLNASRELASKISGGRPVVTAGHVPERIMGVSDGLDKGPRHLHGKSVFGFSGIADPASFALILKQLGAKITGFRAFPDHHDYTEAEIEELEALARGSGAEALVATEKDAVKLVRLVKPGIEVISVGVDLKLAGGGQALENMLKERAFKV